MTRRHALHTDREHGSDDCGKTLGNRRDGQRDAQNEDVEEPRGTAHVFDHHDRDDHDHGDRHNDDTKHLAGASQFPLQGRRLVGRRLQQSGNAPHLGVHAGRGDDRLSMSVCRGGAAEDHVVPIAERHLLRARGGILRDGQALTGEWGLARLQRRRLDQSAAGGNGVAFFDEDDVARNDLRRGDVSPLAAPDHRRSGCRHRAKGRHRSLGTRLLHVAHRGVQKYDGKDGDGFVGESRVSFNEPEHGGDPGRHDQQDDEHILKLRQETAPGRDRLLAGKLVHSVCGEPFARVVVAQAALLIGAEHQFVRVQPVRVTRLWRFAAPLPSTPTSARWIPAGAVGTVAVLDDGSVIEALRRGDDTAFARLVDHDHASLGPVARLSGKADAVTQSAIGFPDDGVSRFASSAMRSSRIL